MQSQEGWFFLRAEDDRSWTTIVEWTKNETHNRRGCPFRAEILVGCFPRSACKRQLHEPG
jgi:hypothetical protein